MYFKGQYVYRTANGTMAVFIPLIVCVGFLGIANHLLRQDGQTIARFVAASFAIGATFFGVLGAIALFSWIADKRDNVEIGENGITYRGHFRPWDRVLEFYGARYSNGVCLGYTAHSGFCFDAGRMPTTPLLTDQQYTELALAIHHGITSTYPNVKVQLYPMDAWTGT